MEQIGNFILDGAFESRHVLALFTPAEPTELRPKALPMRTYLITYDLAGDTRHRLAGAIMQLGDAWARPLETTWYVQSSERASALEGRLKHYLECEDGLLIQQVESNAVLLNTTLRWFRKRRHENGLEADNVIALPVARIPEARAA